MPAAATDSASAWWAATRSASARTASHSRCSISRGSSSDNSANAASSTRRQHPVDHSTAAPPHSRRRADRPPGNPGFGVVRQRLERGPPIVDVTAHHRQFRPYKRRWPRSLAGAAARAPRRSAPCLVQPTELQQFVRRIDPSRPPSLDEAPSDRATSIRRARPPDPPRLDPRGRARSTCSRMPRSAGTDRRSDGPEPAPHRARQPLVDVAEHDQVYTEQVPSLHLLALGPGAASQLEGVTRQLR